MTTPFRKLPSIKSKGNNDHQKRDWTTPEDPGTEEPIPLFAEVHQP